MPLISVCFNSKYSLNVHVNDTDRIKDLKEAVCDKIKVNQDELTLTCIFAGRELRDDLQIQNLEIGQQSVLHIMQVCARKPLTTTSEHNNAIPIEDSYENENVTQLRSRKYVFCKVCKSIQPGKLRVKCSKCKESAFLLSKEPDGWSDILRTGDVDGRCEINGCGHTKGRYYFKCASHQSVPNVEDNCVALSLIGTNMWDLPCLTCTAIDNPVLVFPCDVSHVLCLECFNQYCNTCLNERNFIHSTHHGYTLQCPAGCTESMITETHHFRIMGEEQYNKYQRFGTEECLLQMGGVLCPSRDCGAGLIPDIHSREVVCTNTAVGGCGLRFCKYCLSEYHDGNCQETVASTPSGAESPRIKLSLEDRASIEMLIKEKEENKTKQCPQCKVLTHKTGGCMHITCSRCKLNWCWECSKLWNRDCQADHWFG